MTTMSKTSPRSPWVFLAFLVAVPPQLCLARPHPTQSSKPLALVVNYPYEIAGDGETFLHVVLHTPNMKPAAGAVVRVDGKEMCRADAHGTCIFRFRPGSGNLHRLMARLKRAGVVYEVSHGFACNARTQSFRTDHLFVYLDRGVYNPGDTVHVRLIAWQLLGAYTPIEGADVDVLLQTTDGKVLGGGRVHTDDFGTAALDLPLPSTMPPGSYELAVLYQRARHTARLRVVRHTAPVLAIHHDLPRWVGPATRVLDMEVGVESLVGASLDGVEVQVAGLVGERVVLAPRALQRQGEAARWTGRLAESELDALRKAAGEEGTFDIVLTASTPDGLHTELHRPIVATARPYRAVLEPDKDAYVAGERARLDVKVADFDGRPARDLPIRCQADPGAHVVDVRTDAHGVATCTFEVPGDADALQVQVTTPSMSAPLGTVSLPRRRPKPLVSKVTQPPRRAGGSVHLRAVFDPNWVPQERVVHVDMTDASGAIVVATTVPVRRRDHTWVAEGDVAVPTWGTMLVNVYALASAAKTTRRHPRGVHTVGLVTEGQRVTVAPAARADITLTGVPERAAPGAVFQVRVAVETPQGGASALGASLTDAGILSLLDPLEVLPQDVFYDPRGKALATGGAGVLTWPVVDRNWGMPRHDIAYTNWGFKAPGGFPAPHHRRHHAKAGTKGKVLEAPQGGAGFGEQGLVHMEAAPSAPPHAGPSAEKKEAEADALAQARTRAGTGHAREPRRSTRPRITIRTEFPDTALWLPRLRTDHSGVATFEVKLPDAVGVQRLTVVASDRHGNVGVQRADVTVRQDLAVTLSLPARATVGDRVRAVAAVSNGRDAPLPVCLDTPSTADSCDSGRGAVLRVTCEGADVAVGTPDERVEVAPHEAAGIPLDIELHRAGVVTCRARVATAHRIDEEVRTVRVRPAGAPVVAVASGVATAETPWRVPFEVPQGQPWRGWIEVGVSPVVAALSGWQVLRCVHDGDRGSQRCRSAPPTWGVRGVAAYVLGTCARLDAFDASRDARREREALRASLRRAAIELAVAQESSGAWSFHAAPDAANPRGGVERRAYLTAYVLRAVAALRRHGILVEDDAVHKAVQWLLAQRGGDGLWSPGSAWFWAPRAAHGGDWALTADIATSIVEALATLDDATPPAALRGVVDGVRKRLQSLPDDVAFAAHGARLLQVWSEWTGDAQASAAVARAFDGLLALRRRGHWEPHWYHAWGGTVELDAVLLGLVLARPDWNAHTGLVRELVSSLEATRTAWGTWHNEIGTAVAVEALLAAAAKLGTQAPDAVVVELDGAQIARATRATGFDALRWIDLPAHLSPGAHELTVRLEGGSRATVQLSTQRQILEADCDGVCLRRHAPAEARAGAAFDVELTLEPLAPGDGRGVELVDNLPAGVRVLTASLDALVQHGVIEAYSVDGDALTLALPPVTAPLTLRYRAVAMRAGTFAHPGAIVRPANGPTILALARDAALRVR